MSFAPAHSELVAWLGAYPLKYMAHGSPPILREDPLVSQSLIGSVSLLLALATASAAQPGPLVPQGMVRQIKVLTDKAPDCSSLKSIVESVTRGCTTNDEKAVAIYDFMRLTHYHFATPSEPGGISVLKEINCYGWSLCGGLHATESALWRELGWGSRMVAWSDPGHTTAEAYYDGRWHYLDVFLKFYAWMPDPKHPGRRTIAGEDDLAADPLGLLTRAFVMDKARNVMYAVDDQFRVIDGHANWTAPAFLVCGDDLPGLASGVRHRGERHSDDGWDNIHTATGDYSADVNLAPGSALTSTWEKLADAWYRTDSPQPPGHTCGDKEIRNSPEKGLVAEPYLGPDFQRESYANGLLTFRPDLSGDASLQSFAAVENAKVVAGRIVPADASKPASVTVLLQSPYIMTRASGSAEGADRIEVSIDGGKSWRGVEVKDFGAAVKGKVSALVRLTFKEALSHLHLIATVQNNPFALPYLSPGRNTVSVSVYNPKALGGNRLVVTYAYCPGTRDKSYEQLYSEGKEIARAHNARWDAAPTVVQREFTASQLPATFEIDVPTPREKYPVYPRMVFVRREVLGPGQKPLAVPEGAKPSIVGPNDELKTLPSPLTIGIHPAQLVGAGK